MRRLGENLSGADARDQRLGDEEEVDAGGVEPPEARRACIKPAVSALGRMKVPVDVDEPAGRLVLGEFSAARRVGLLGAEARVNVERGLRDVPVAGEDDASL